MKYEHLVDGLRAEVVKVHKGEILVAVANCSDMDYAEMLVERINELFALIAEGVLDE